MPFDEELFAGRDIIILGVVEIVILILIFGFVGGHFGTVTDSSVEEPEAMEETDDLGFEIFSSLSSDSDSDTESTEPGEAMEDKSPQTHTIEMSSEGFSTKGLIIRDGDTVNFIAVDDTTRWPASAVHPTHKLYPGSDISKCNTGEESMIFDACEGILGGGGYSFTFTEPGEWPYHDHLDPFVRGVITVTRKL